MKDLSRKFFFVAASLIAFLYFLACLTPIISPEHGVIMGFLGLAFPLLLLGLLLAVGTSFFVNRKLATVLLVLLFCGSFHIIHLLSWHKPHFTLKKQPGTIRIMGWNVMNLEKNHSNPADPFSACCPIFQYIQEQQPDIICMQDFYERGKSRQVSNIRQMQAVVGYPYYAFSNDYQEYPDWGPNYAGVAIFSKYPLHHIQRIPFSGKIKPHSVLTADVTINNITRRIIVTHLQSMHLKNLKLNDKASYEWDEDSAINYNNSVVHKLTYYLGYHAKQADLVKKVITMSPHPVIFSADMNEVPTSYSYNTISRGLKDAFLEKGTGLGRTYYRISPTLRIDYLLHDPKIEIVQYKKDTVLLSDHYSQIMDVRW